jgi:hypothetical protein
VDDAAFIHNVISRELLADPDLNQAGERVTPW